MPSVVWDEKRFSAVLRLLRESMFFSENRLEPFACVAASIGGAFGAMTKARSSVRRLAGMLQRVVDGAPQIGTRAKQSCASVL